MTQAAVQPPVDQGKEEAFNALMSMLGELKKSQATWKLKEKYTQTHEQNPAGGGPYPWGVRFHEAGKTFPYRAIIAANRVGKTYTAAAEIAIHLTGNYPPWWNGRRFTKPIEAWVAGTTNQDVRDIQQQELMGKVEEGRIFVWYVKSDYYSISCRVCGLITCILLSLEAVGGIT